MLNKFVKSCFLFIILTGVLMSVGCSSGGGQEALVLDESQVISGLRSSLEKGVKPIPPVTKFKVNSIGDVVLTKLSTSGSIRNDNAATDWSFTFKDLEGELDWIVTVPGVGGVVFQGSDKAIVKGKISGNGITPFDVTFELYREGAEQANEWKICDIQFEAVIAVNTGITGIVKSRENETAGVKGITVIAYKEVENGKYDNTPASQTTTDDSGKYVLTLEPGFNYLVVFQGVDFEHKQIKVYWDSANNIFTDKDPNQSRP